MIIAWTGVMGMGQSFLDWSLYYLSGKDQFWNMKLGWQDLLSDPVTGRNAHLHKKNHPNGIINLKDFIRQAKSLDGDQLITVHPFAGHEEGLGEFKSMVETCLENNIKVVTIRQTRPYPYLASERNEWTDEEELEVLRPRIGYPDADRRTIRDQMSFRVMNNRKIFLEDIDRFHEQFDGRLDFVITDEQWANDTEQVMIDLFKRLGLEMRSEKLQSWRTIRNKWRENYGKLIDWYERDLERVVDAIANGDDLDLTPYKIKLAKEILIMAHLLKKHGRRLWLPDDNFPKNTKELNNFLK